MACIYALISKSNPEEYRYIGKTAYETPDKRFKGHKNNAISGDSAPVYRWIRKHNDVEVVIIEDRLSKEESSIREKYYIHLFRSQGHKLLNVSDGGDGSPGRVLSKASREKISSKLKGKSLSLEHRKNISAGQTGRKLSEKTKKKISQSLKNHPRLIACGKKNKGKKHTEEARRKISEAKTGKPATEKQLLHLARLAKLNREKTKN